MQPIFYALIWRLLKLLKFEPVSAIRLVDSREDEWSDDERNLGRSDLQLAGEA